MRSTLLILLTITAVASATITSVTTDKTEYQVGDTVIVSWTYDVIPEGYYSLSALVAYQSNGNDAPIGQSSPFLKLEDRKTPITTDKNAFSSDQYFVLLRLIHTQGNFTELQSDYITFLRKGDDSGDLGRPGANDQGHPNPIGATSAGSRLKPWFM